MNNIASLVIVLIAVPASAGVSAGVDQTLGSSRYRATRIRASFDIGESAYIAPSFSAYRSDASSGTYKSIGLRFGYETGPFSFGIEGAVQPKNNGYRKTSLGADATFSLTPGGSKQGHKMAGPSSGGEETFGAGLAAVDVGAALMRMRHEDDFAAGTSGRRREGARRAAALVINQTDLSIFAGLRFLMAEFSAEATKSSYDRDLTGSNARESMFLALTGFDSIVQGFPDTSVNAQVKWKTLPLVKPYLSYTHTTFKLGSAPSNGYEAGARVGLNMISLKASYQRYVQKGFADQNYYTLGASLNF